jgi:hypothetical protein
MAPLHSNSIIHIHQQLTTTKKKKKKTKKKFPPKSPKNPKSHEKQANLKRSKKVEAIVHKPTR